MEKPTVSFCTYTYNDAAMVAELVRMSQLFTIRPDEVVVVDDGSDVPFTMEDAPDNLRVIRFAENKGITCAKGNGISAATGDLIFSMDCDTRVSPDWLERNMDYALNPDIGLTGGSLAHGAGDDLVSRYMRTYGDNHNLHHVGPVDFIPGNAFLLRRKTWQRIGGFSGYNLTNCQDHYLCNLLKKCGYTLFSNAEAKAWQRRRMIRTTMCKRVWKWCHKAVKTQMLESKNPVGYLFEMSVKPMMDRFESSMEKGEMLFLYLDMLYFAYTVLDMLDHSVRHGQMKQGERDGFLTGLDSLFARYPAIQAVFRQDMRSLGLDIVGSSEIRPAIWNDFFVFAQPLRKGGLMDWLNRQGVMQLLEEDSRDDYHFSSYAEADFSADMAV